MIRVNDKLDVEWERGMTVETLLLRCGFTYPLLVVSINGELIDRDTYETATVPDRSDVRVLHLVAGG